MKNHETEIDVVGLFKILWGSKYKILKLGALGFVVGVIIAISIPKMYNTTVKVTPEDSDLKSSLGDMGDLAGMVGINLDNGSSGITSMIYPDVVQSTPFLLEFTDIEITVDDDIMTFYKYVTEEQKQAWWGYVTSAPGRLIGLFSAEEEGSSEIDMFRPDSRQKQYLEFMHSNISIEADKKTNILTIGVNMQDPLVAAIIADSLLSKLQIYMTDYRTNKARKDLEAKEQMCQEAKSNYYIAEDALAEGLDFNRNVTSQRGQVKINRLTDEKDLAFTVYKELAKQVKIDKVRLQDKTPIATIIEPSTVANKASSPNKILISLLFAFFGGTIMSVIVLFKHKIFRL